MCSHKIDLHAFLVRLQPLRESLAETRACKSSTHVLTPPYIGSLWEVARDNIFHGPSVTSVREGRGVHAPCSFHNFPSRSPLLSIFYPLLLFYFFSCSFFIFLCFMFPFNFSSCSRIFSCSMLFLEFSSALCSFLSFLVLLALGRVHTIREKPGKW